MYWVNSAPALLHAQQRTQGMPPPESFGGFTGSRSQLLQANNGPNLSTSELLSDMAIVGAAGRCRDHEVESWATHAQGHAQVFCSCWPHQPDLKAMILAKGSCRLTKHGTIIAWPLHFHGAALWLSSRVAYLIGPSCALKT